MKKTILCALVALILGVFSASAIAKPLYKWRLAESWPENFPIYGQSVKDFIKLVEQMSNGRIVIESYTSNQHKKPLNVLEMVRDGEFEMGHTATYYSKGMDINTLFFTAVPFGMITNEKESWFYHGGGLEYMQKVYAKHGIYAYPGGNSSNQMGGWFRKEIKSFDDLKGLRMRIPGLAGDVMKTLGVDVTNLPPGELYNALESGRLDALEWVGPSLDIGMGFHKIAPYYYTGWHEPGSALAFYINLEVFEKLPKDLQEILVTAMRVTSYDMYSKVMYESAINLNRMRAEYPNIKIRAFPREIMRHLSRETQRQIDELVKEDPLAREIVDSMRNYKDKVRLWTRVSDQAYINNAGL